MVSRWDMQNRGEELNDQDGIGSRSRRRDDLKVDVWDEEWSSNEDHMNVRLPSLCVLARFESFQINNK